MKKLIREDKKSIIGATVNVGDCRTTGCNKGYNCCPIVKRHSLVYECIEAPSGDCPS